MRRGIHLWMNQSVVVTGLMGFGPARHGPVRLGLVWHGQAW